MKYYLIAGEASGDLHGSNLIKELLKKDPKAEIRFWGGDLMQQEGGMLVKHYKELAFMGFVEVILHLKTILNNLSFCKKDLEAFMPDVIIFIDYPGFNLRIAKWAKAKGFVTHYYISPQIWAWKENRIKAIKRDIDKMYVILPFEKSYYEEKHNFPVHFVGHPLMDAIENYKHQNNNLENFKEEHQLDNRPIIALLPGSRKQEISKSLSIFKELTNTYPNYQFVIAGAPSITDAFYQQISKGTGIKHISNQTYALLSHADAALVTSGTATLETALFEVPQVVCYKGNTISYWIAKQVVKLKYISLVNLIMNQAVVKELIQDDFDIKQLQEELDALLNPKNRAKIITDYKKLKDKLGGGGASKEVANLILKNIKT